MTFVLHVRAAEVVELIFGTPDFDCEVNTAEPSLLVQHAHSHEVVVTTGAARFRLVTGKEVFLAGASDADHGDKFRCRLQLKDVKGHLHLARLGGLRVEETGPVCTVVAAEASLSHGLRLAARFSFFAGCGRVRIALTTQNPRRAKHFGGYWDLGDPGSVLLKELSLLVEVLGGTKQDVTWLEQPAGPVRRTMGNHLEIYQDSSGGNRWNSRNHVNRQGRLPLRFRGFRVSTMEGESTGDRASPAVSVASGTYRVACALEEFWQKFPSAIVVNNEQMSVGLLPKQFGDLHELQGGEHNTRVVWLDFGPELEDPCRRLASIHDAPFAIVDPAWVAMSGAVPFLPAPDQPNRRALSLCLRDAIDGDCGFFAKREAIDEYGWRNFGDMWADHEEVYAEGPRPVISHYNNQYDLLHGLLIQYLATGEARWWDLAAPLAQHVMDIDIYHTDRDKSAYSGGLFWHTAHYHDAGTSTHRCMSAAMRGKKIPAPGTGPCNEHNYTSGLLLYYYLTGCRRAQESVLGLADWVLAMDDGRRHVLGIISNQPTGDASRTCAADYYGPGRGAANSINALLDAWLLTFDKRYVEKVEELIRRSIHPCEDLAKRNLRNAEMRWSYTVFLQALGRFLELTKGYSDFETLRDYACDSLLHYARWMAEHETFYLDDPEKLEYPTETWAAQELRKGNVLLMAACFAAPSEATWFRRRGSEFLDRAWQQFMAFPTRHFTRPVAVVLQQGYLERFWKNVSEPDLQLTRDCAKKLGYDAARDFISQKDDIRRAARSLFGIGRMLASACYPPRWFNAWKQTWICERLRILSSR